MGVSDMFRSKKLRLKERVAHLEDDVRRLQDSLLESQKERQLVLDLQKVMLVKMSDLQELVANSIPQQSHRCDLSLDQSPVNSGPPKPPRLQLLTNAIRHKQGSPTLTIGSSEGIGSLSTVSGPDQDPDIDGDSPLASSETPSRESDLLNSKTKKGWTRVFPVNALEELKSEHIAKLVIADELF